MRKFGIERHQYAPELNKIIFDNGATMAAPYITEISEAKRRYFAPLRPGRYCVIDYINSDYPSLNRTYCGYTQNNYSGIKLMRRVLERRHNIPGGKTLISIKYIGGA